MAISKNTLDFLVENRIMDSREWFAEHKPQYRELVLAPLMDLVEKLAPTLLAIDPLLIVEPKVDKSISRVYRDTRFSRDKSFYRDVMWCMFTRPREQGHWPPGFFFEFSPNGFFYGCGDYSAPAGTMQAIREMVLKDDKRYLEAQKAINKQKIFKFEGDQYKRPRYVGESEEKREWLERRNLFFAHRSKDFDLLFSGDLYKKLARDYKKLAPVYEFLRDADQIGRA